MTTPFFQTETFKCICEEIIGFFKSIEKSETIWFPLKNLALCNFSVDLCFNNDIIDIALNK